MSGKVQILLSHITIREGLDRPVVVIAAATRDSEARRVRPLLRVDDTICRLVNIFPYKDLLSATETSFGHIDLWQVYYVLVEIHIFTGEL